MPHRLRSIHLRCVLLVLLTMAGFTAPKAWANPVVKLKGEGSITFDPFLTSHFTLTGTASHLGEYTCDGEIKFLPGESEGTFEGTGVAVIKAANGDLIVGIVHWRIDGAGIGSISFSWRDSVTLEDGTVISDTGRFIESRPAGAVSRTKFITDGTSNIIAILIG